VAAIVFLALALAISQAVKRLEARLDIARSGAASPTPMISVLPHDRRSNAAPFPVWTKCRATISTMRYLRFGCADEGHRAVILAALAEASLKSL
jgi:hypothetical protein